MTRSLYQQKLDIKYKMKCTLTADTCLKMHVGEDPEKVGARIIEVEGAPNLDRVTIPYFIEITEGREGG